MSAARLRPNRPFHVRLLRALLHVLSVICVVLLVGVGAQALVEHNQRGRFPPPGQLVDIGGGRFIHVRQWGESNVGGTIVLDISAAGISSIWSWVGAGLAERGYRVVAYDRPGMAWSHGPWQPRDARHAADALSAALDASAIPGPYIVVAHSYGAFSSRVFTGINRDRVSALVLLDTTHPGAPGPILAVPYRFRAWIGRTGLFLLSPPHNTMGSLPAEEVEAAHAVSHWTTHLDTSAEELEAWDTSAQQVRAFSSFGDLPVLVVAAAGSEAHLELQRDLLNVSDASQYVYLEVDHMGMLLNQSDAAAVVDTIDRFLDVSN